MAQADAKAQMAAGAVGAPPRGRPDRAADSGAASLKTEQPVAPPSSPAGGRAEGARLQLDPLVPQLLLWVAAGLLLLSVRRAYARTTRPLARLRRLALACLRAGAAVAVVFCLARPVLVQQRQLREQALAFIAVDSSASMDLRDAPGGRT
ncbi:MAG: hypothetical protein NTW87_33145, partial [Planctomycetota bacterium]|nr:hypothetical protein [Planctomycetota bacterium]